MNEIYKILRYLTNENLKNVSNLFTGDIVGLYDENQQANHVTGVICSISSKAITVSIDESFEDLDQESTYFVLKLANDVTYKRLKRYCKDSINFLDAHLNYHKIYLKCA